LYRQRRLAGPEVSGTPPGMAFGSKLRFLMKFHMRIRYLNYTRTSAAW
jgi:hypothetical protein